MNNLKKKKKQRFWQVGRKLQCALLKQNKKSVVSQAKSLIKFHFPKILVTPNISAQCSATKFYNNKYSHKLEAFGNFAFSSFIIHIWTQHQFIFFFITKYSFPTGCNYLFERWWGSRCTVEGFFFLLQFQ